MILLNFIIVVSKKEEILMEKQILKKVDEYRLELNSELLQLLAEERKIEEQREYNLKQIISEIEKKNLNNIYGRERSITSKKIISLNK